MFLLALMMSSCPSDPSKIDSVRNKALTSSDSLYKLTSRNIPLWTIQKEDENKKKFIEVVFKKISEGNFTSHMFEIIRESDSNKSIKIALHELSKYFQPLLESRTIDYILFDDGTKLNNLEDYKLGVEDTFVRFTKNLHHFDEGNRYIDTLSDNIISESEDTSSLEELLKYLQNLEYFINQMSYNPSDYYTPYYSGPLYDDLHDNNNFSEDSVKIILSILTEHERVFNNLFEYLNEKKSHFVSENEKEMFLIIKSFLETIELKRTE